MLRPLYNFLSLQTLVQSWSKTRHDHEQTKPHEIATDFAISRCIRKGVDGALNRGQSQIGVQNIPVPILTRCDLCMQAL